MCLLCSALFSLNSSFVKLKGAISFLKHDATCSPKISLRDWKVKDFTVDRLLVRERNGLSSSGECTIKLTVSWLLVSMDKASVLDQFIVCLHSHLWPSLPNAGTHPIIDSFVFLSQKSGDDVLPCGLNSPPSREEDHAMLTSFFELVGGFWCAVSSIIYNVFDLASGLVCWSMSSPHISSLCIVPIGSQPCSHTHRHTHL